MNSFKLKLVAYFLVLSLLPLTAAYLGFDGVADRGVTAGADARLEAGLRAAAAAFEDERRAAQRDAETLARDPRFQRALAAGDTAAVRRLLARSPGLRVELGDERIGAAPPRAAEARVTVVLERRPDAAVVAAVALDRGLAARLRARSGLAEEDELAVVVGGRITAATGEARGALPLGPGRVGTVAVGGADYRAVSVRILPVDEAALAALTPEAVLRAEQAALGERLLLWLATSLLLIAVIAYAAARSIVGALARLVAAANSIAAGRLGERVPVRGRDEFARLARAFNEMAAQLEGRLEELEAERRRLRDANARFGEALAATLDPAQLRRAIVETAVETTGAAGGVLIADDGSVVAVGDADAGPARLEYPLSSGRASFGSLVVVGESFELDARLAGASLAGQAVVALENVRLHRIVERQALVDGLTGLSNRRQLDETLASELARGARFGIPVALILADVDDFKAVNDRHGHPTGDLVLRGFAAALRDTVREIDVAGRWGGEEFAVVAPGTDLDGAVQLAERIREAVEERSIAAPDGSPLHVTASFGVAAFPAERTRTALVAAADEALYGAKRRGKNRVVAREGAARPA